MNDAMVCNAPKEIGLSDVVEYGLKQVQVYQTLLGELMEKLAPVLVPSEPCEPCDPSCRPNCPVDTPLAKYLHGAIQDIEKTNGVLHDVVSRIRL